MKLSKRAQFLVENLDLEAAVGFPGVSWEPFQIDFLNETSTLRIDLKSRQVAWSWIIAAEAVANAALYGISTIFVSINLSEAKEKIVYAKRVIDNLPDSVLPKTTRKTGMGLEFENKSRIMSMPSRPPRGKAAFNVRLDEFAHVQFDRDIYTACMPILSKGGNLRIGSSPLGASGVFWEVFSEKIRPYKGYVRKSIPWWKTNSFCIDIVEASNKAEFMLTPDRVERFGNERIKLIHGNMPEEDFRQEYECEFVDESVAWFTWDEIKSNQNPPAQTIMGRGDNDRISKVLQAIAEFAALVQRKKLEPSFACGIDIGRTRDTTEIFLVGKSSVESYPLRLALTLDRCEFDTQFDVMHRVLSEVPITQAFVDQNGIGRNLSERLKKSFPAKVFPQTFSRASKEQWATDAKMMLQQKRTPLPLDREIMYQIHSIKRLISGTSKQLRFDSDRNEKHHADKAWAWMLALAAANARERKVTW